MAKTKRREIIVWRGEVAWNIGFLQYGSLMQRLRDA
jgi:hypothetical protein